MRDMVNENNAYYKNPKGKHTPGPWRAGAVKMEETTVRGPIVNVLANGAMFDMQPALVGGRTPDEAEANAWLIAAAPEMHELLQAVLKTEGKASVAFPIMALLDRIGAGMINTCPDCGSPVRITDTLYNCIRLECSACEWYDITCKEEQIR